MVIGLVIVIELERGKDENGDGRIDDMDFSWILKGG